MLSRNVSAFRHEIESHKSTVPEPKLSSAGRLLNETCSLSECDNGANVRAPTKRAGRGLVADERFHHLGTGLSVILIFIGVKMLIANIQPIPSLVSLAVIVCVLAGSIILSLLRPPDGAAGGSDS